MMEVPSKSIKKVELKAELMPGLKSGLNALLKYEVKNADFLQEDRYTPNSICKCIRRIAHAPTV
jgi:hypothetical protein